MVKKMVFAVLRKFWASAILFSELDGVFWFIVGFVHEQCGLFECAFNIRIRCIFIHELVNRDFWSMDFTVRDNCLVFNPKHSR